MTHTAAPSLGIEHTNTNAHTFHSAAASGYRLPFVACLQEVSMLAREQD